MELVWALESEKSLSPLADVGTAQGQGEVKGAARLTRELLCEDVFELVRREQSLVKQQVSSFLQTLTDQNQELMGGVSGQQRKHL